MNNETHRLIVDGETFSKGSLDDCFFDMVQNFGHMTLVDIYSQGHRIEGIVK